MLQQVVNWETKLYAKHNKIKNKAKIDLKFQVSFDTEVTHFLNFFSAYMTYHYTLNKKLNGFDIRRLGPKSALNGYRAFVSVRL